MGESSMKNAAIAIPAGISHRRLERGLAADGCGFASLMLTRLGGDERAARAPFS